MATISLVVIGPKKPKADMPTPRRLRKNDHKEKLTGLKEQQKNEKRKKAK